jgi:phage recombination protein Bet
MVTEKVNPRRMGKVSDTTRYPDNMVFIDSVPYTFADIRERVLDPINPIVKDMIVVFETDGNSNRLVDIYDSKARDAPPFQEHPDQITNANAAMPAQREVTIDVPPEVPIQRMFVSEPSQVVVRQECAPKVYSAEEIGLIKAMVAKDCTDTEFKLLMYLSNTYGLDPLLKQIWAVKYQGRAALIFCGRDGFLQIAHRSGQFDGMESDVIREEGQIIGAYCKVWRKDMSHPFEVRVLLAEYTTGKNLWHDKPGVMIVKVAESQCLRRAFQVAGIYSQDEISTQETL